MKDNGQHTDALEYLGIEPTQIGDNIYKSSCKYDEKGNRIGAFLIYKDEGGFIRYTQRDYVDLNDKAKTYLGDAIRLGQASLGQNNPDRGEQREHLNKLLASVMSQAFCGNYTVSAKNYDEAEKFYKSIISEHIRKHNCIIGIVYMALALLALAVLYIIHSDDLSVNICQANVKVKLSNETAAWYAGVIASVLGAVVSICHKSKVRIIKDKLNATWKDFIMEDTIRILFGIILAMILIAAVKTGWISSNLLANKSVLSYMLIGFLAGFMEGKITSIANKLSNLVGIFDDETSNTNDKKTNE